jgi:hypothetical protein
VEKGKAGKDGGESVKPLKNLRELKAEFRNIKSRVADDTGFIAKAFMFQIEQNEKRAKKKETDASVFIKYKIRFENMNFIDALNAWKEKEKEEA